jgi:hypothetical protein
MLNMYSNQDSNYGIIQEIAGKKRFNKETYYRNIGVMLWA